MWSGLEFHKEQNQGLLTLSVLPEDRVAVEDWTGFFQKDGTWLSTKAIPRLLRIFLTWAVLWMHIWSLALFVQFGRCRRCYHATIFSLDYAFWNVQYHRIFFFFSFHFNLRQKPLCNSISSLQNIMIFLFLYNSQRMQNIRFYATITQPGMSQHCSSNFFNSVVVMANHSSPKICSGLGQWLFIHAPYYWAYTTLPTALKAET